MRGLTGELVALDIDSLLLNIHDDIGMTLRPRFDFVFSPTYLVLTPEGEEVYRSHTTPRLDEIRLALLLETSDRADPLTSNNQPG